ncbi:hypothetical protein [Paenibacillus andongensis]|uniref:hypothetical protein n=1 Tax=Paenibacillus andongensis TaxID=2975482 RepID=UPI0021BA5E9B|nr:hypothetical protein [Paenibacillus andongensis]
MTVPVTQQTEGSQVLQDPIVETYDVAEEALENEVTENEVTTGIESHEEQSGNDHQTDPTAKSNRRRRPNNHS